MTFDFDVPVAVAELAERAGPPDTDRPAWLAARMGGVTATEIRDLYLAKGSGEAAYARAVQDLVALKLGRRKDTFSGNAFTEWGNDREPIIASDLAWEYNVLPEARVFHAADNERFLASPDGVGVEYESGALLLSEIKTSGYDLSDPATLAKKGYVAQMVWAMRVTGAAKCRFEWEWRHGRPGSFTVGERSGWWVDYDPELAAELEEIAVAFLDERDRQEAGGTPPDDAADYEEDVANYLNLTAAAERLKAQIDEVKQRMLDRIGDRAGFKVTTQRATVTFVSPKPSIRFDETAWKAKAPKAHEAYLAAKKRYTKEVPATPHLRITPVNEEENE